MAHLPFQILSVCLNPAWQKTLFFERVTPGAVNRANEMRESGGGKGVNLARALRCQGESVTVACFSGGSTGELLQRDLNMSGIACISVPTSAATRVCTTVVQQDPKCVTELIEPSAAISADAAAQMGDMLCSQVDRFAGIALAGTYPPGISDDVYASVARRALASDVPLLLDGVRGVIPTLKAGVSILKINRDELRELTSKPGFQAAVDDCFRRFRLDWLAVTDGPRRAYLANALTTYAFDIPPVSPCRNPIGAGDCASGILLAGLARLPTSAGRGTSRWDDTAVAQVFSTALAAASASCMTDLPAVFAPAAAAHLVPRIACIPGDTE